MALTDLKRRVIIENTLVSPRQSRVMVNLQDKFMSYRDVNPLTNSDCRMTNCHYSIRYDAPRKLEQYHIGDLSRPFSIGTDLLGFHLTVAGPRQFEKLAESVPEIAWMIRNTNYSSRLFHIARTHIGICIPFCVDMAKYEKKLLQQAKKEGLKDTADFNAFVSFRCAVAREQDYSKTVPFSPPASRYAKELEEAYKIKENFEVKNNKEHESEEATEWVIKQACKNI